MKNLRPCIRESLDGKTWREPNAKASCSSAFKGNVFTPPPTSPNATQVYNLNTYALNLIDIFIQNTFYFIYSFDTWVKHQVPSKEFKLHFFFAQNPYFKNTVVNKTNHMIEEDDSILEKAIIG